MQLSRGRDMAWRRGVLGAFVVLAATCLLFGCSRVNPPISNGEVARILQRHQVANCDPQTIFIRSGKFGTGQEQYFENWFDKSVLVDRRFMHLSDSKNKSTRQGDLSYNEQGHSFHVAWSQSDPPDIPSNNSFSINACVYVPKRIKVIDASFNSGSGTARILFAETFRLSLLGQLMSEKGVLKKYDTVGPPENFEYVALLSKVHSGQWRIAGIGLN